MMHERVRSLCGRATSARTTQANRQTWDGGKGWGESDHRHAVPRNTASDWTLASPLSQGCAKRRLPPAMYGGGWHLAHRERGDGFDQFLDDQDDGAQARDLVWWPVPVGCSGQRLHGLASVPVHDESEDCNEKCIREDDT